MFIMRLWMMCLVGDLLLICALYLVWLPARGASQQITAEHFQSFVEERIRRLAQTADDAYLNIIVNITGNQSCPYGDQLYDTCNDTLQPNGITFDEAFMRDISLSASSVYYRQFLAGYASLYSTINDYRPVEDLFPRLCMSEALSNAWTNYSNNSTLSINDGLLLHFYGDQESGIIRTNPYFSHDPKSDVCSLRQLDPRFRPWYVSTVTASKAIYVLLHSNKFDMLPLMREAAVRLLNTLSHQDYFLIWYSNGNRFSDNFVLTNESTRVKIEQFINSSTQQKLNPSLSIGVHLTEVITLFGSLNQSVCHRIIVIMSDTALDRTIVDAVDRSKQENGVQQLDIFTMIFGIEADDRYAALLSCSNGGDHFVVTDLAGVNEAIASYYQIYSAAVSMETDEREVSWSEVYSDFFLATDVLSACLPVRDVSTAELLGVTCVDVNVTFFRSLNSSDQVISALVNNSTVTCPITDITEELRNRWRTYRYCERPANLSTIDQVITLYEDKVMEVINLLILARPVVQNIPLTGLSRKLCPFGSTVYDACSDDFLPYSFSIRLGNNISNISSNVIFSPATASLLRNVSLVSYSIDNPLFEPLCYSSIADRQWYKLLTLNPQTTQQYYASDEGFVRLYPAIRYNQCYPPSLDPRTRPFYAAAASGRKDVVMVMDITNNASVPVAIAAVRDILSTLSAIDYFNVISATGLFSTGLSPAIIANKMNVNTTYLPTIVAMTTDQSSLVTMAFQAITNGINNNNTANCQIAIIIITDRQITWDTGEAVVNGNRNIQPNAPAKLFVTSLTNDLTSYYDIVAVQLTCNHSGIWNKVSSSTYSHSSTASVISYYRVLASAVMVTAPVWSEIYEDFTGTGEIVTVCQPHYDETINIGQLLGVACADVTIDLLQQVGASLDFISSLINRQHSLLCYQSLIPVAMLESLRPLDAKCLSAPPTTSVTTIISSTSFAIVTSSSTIVTAAIGSSTTTVTATTGIIVSSLTPTINSTISGSSSGSSLSGGAIAGIIVACVVFLTIVLIILIGCYHYRNIRQYRVHGGRDYKRYTLGKEFINNDLSDALLSEVENDEKDEL